jgi:pimeloyl-ACP methyl ester carboxylesterase
LLLAALAVSSCAAKTRPINSPDSIFELQKVILGGVEQWILIRGNDAGNPVLLFLHGGPGSPEMPLNHEYGELLEERFVLVHWDQRGAGKSHGDCVPTETMNVEQFISDACALTHYLRHRFDQEKIYLMGHSWGSLLGALTVSRHPELYLAYIGIGQVVDMERNEEISYQFVLEEAKKRDEKLAVRRLEKIGPPPYDDLGELMVQRNYLQKYGGATYDAKGYNQMILTNLKAPEYTPADQINYLRGAYFSINNMWDEVLTYDLTRQVPRIEVPVYFMHGRHDYNTPWELVEEYYEKLDAPAGKTLIWFENSAHSPNMEEPERFAEAMVERVLAETGR